MTNYATDEAVSGITKGSSSKKDTIGAVDPRLRGDDGTMGQCPISISAHHTAANQKTLKTADKIGFYFLAISG